MNEKVSAFSFPGMNFFNKEQAQKLGTLIQEISGRQVSTVDQMCANLNIGWDSSGFPQTAEIAKIEQIVKGLGCAKIVVETARALGITLDTNDVLDIVEKGCRVYEGMPLLVHCHLKQ